LKIILFQIKINHKPSINEIKERLYLKNKPLFSNDMEIINLNKKIQHKTLNLWNDVYLQLNTFRLRVDCYYTHFYQILVNTFEYIKESPKSRLLDFYIDKSLNMIKCHKNIGSYIYKNFIITSDSDNEEENDDYEEYDTKNPTIIKKFESLIRNFKNEMEIDKLDSVEDDIDEFFIRQSSMKFINDIFDNDEDSSSDEFEELFEYPPVMFLRNNTDSEHNVHKLIDFVSDINIDFNNIIQESYIEICKPIIDQIFLFLFPEIDIELNNDNNDTKYADLRVLFFSRIKNTKYIKYTDFIIKNIKKIKYQYIKKIKKNKLNNMTKIKTIQKKIYLKKKNKKTKKNHIL